MRFPFQSPACSITCLVYSHLYPISKWKSHDIDRILDLGVVLFRESLLRHKKAVRELRPDQINSIVYVELEKVSVRVGKSLLTICLGANIMTDIEKGLKEMLDTSKQCVLNYGDRNYAIWVESGAFYMFIAEDTDEEGILVNMNDGVSCVVRCMDMDYLVECLKEILSHIPSVIVCRFYSFEVLKVMKMQQHPDESLVREQANETKRPLRDLIPGALDTKDKPVSDVSIEIPTKVEPYSFHDNLQKHFDAVKLTKDYKKLSEYHEILRSMEYNSCPSKTSTLAAACILMLNKCRAITWTIDTLHDIFALADSILVANPHVIDQKITVSISDLKSPVHFNDQIYSLKTENVIFGQIVTQSVHVTDLNRTIEEFLRGNDIGVIQGPQTITIWQESGLYFMFDPKERDEEGQKYCKTEQDDTQHGSACVLWFNQLHDLIEMYKKNLAPKHMRDLFKIVKVEAVPYISKSPDWHSWKAISSDRWILRGTFDETDEKFEGENRGKQGVCMAATAIAYTKLMNVAKWTTRVIDKILNDGDEFYTITVVKLKFRNKFVTSLLKVDELDKQIKIKDTLIHFNFGKTMINGSLLAQDGATLSQSLTRFFEESKSGILIACQCALAIFKVEGCYYVFDPYPRDEAGENLDVKGTSGS